LERMSDDSVAVGLKQLPNWRREGDNLKRTIVFANFRESLAYVVHIGMLAEKADHHPDIEIHYKTVILTLSTHTANGITTKDFDLAAKIECVLR
jgi:4a-hydroxytetrahydrobiopterin dehydratase